MLGQHPLSLRLLFQQKEKVEELQGANKDPKGEDSNSAGSSNDANKGKSPKGDGAGDNFVLPKDDENDDLEKEREKGKTDAEIFKDLKAQIK